MVIAMAMAAVCAADPAPARADTVFTPFIGQSFATRDDAVKVTTIGASMASTMGGGLGFELDFGRTSEAQGSAAFADNSRVTMLMGNAVLGFPFGRFRPYLVGGLGWLRKEVLGNGATARTGGLGLDLGGGILGFLSGSVGIRVDLRYVRSVTEEDLDTIRAPDSLGFADFLTEDISFWRASTGLAIRF
ncbi:MAG: outer membrane beta-barrel protein [Acidobacteria bacterium]|nr:outer membrane beta-barrel protein [Acidobacteriota bacterium]MYK88754.1 outer membrane beta-barrel protein [Acidobacteriota bacterium]